MSDLGRRPVVVLDEQRLDQFCAALERVEVRRIDRAVFWDAFAEAFPGRPQPPEERRWLLAALEAAVERGVIEFPSERGARWDRTRVPHVPTSVDRTTLVSEPAEASWKTDPWPSSMAWVAGLQRLTSQEYEFLRRVHAGMVHGQFADAAPLKYRSLELTGDEKRLARLMGGRLFGAGRLSLDLLNCRPEQLPIAWERVAGDDGPARVIVFENHASFAMGLDALRAMPDAPYDVIAFGSGKAVGQSIAWLTRIECPVIAIDYVGDLDWDGLKAATPAAATARVVGLPDVRPAVALHHAMHDAAKELGAESGWANESADEAPGNPAPLLSWLSPDLQDATERVLRAGRRIPEEVLGPRQLWNALIYQKRLGL